MILQFLSLDNFFPSIFSLLKLLLLYCKLYCKQSSRGTCYSCTIARSTCRAWKKNSNFSAMAPPIFTGENYQMWAVRMETYYKVPPLLGNPTMAPMKNHKERKTRTPKAKACLFVVVSSSNFTRIMSLKSANAIWDYLKKEYEGDDIIKDMQVLNLIGDFWVAKDEESETIKEYSERLLSIANRARLLGFEFNDSRIVEKILVTVPERFEATITTLENTKDLFKINLTELMNSLQAQERRRVMREDRVVEGALSAKHQEARKKNKKNDKKNQSSSSENFTNNHNQSKGRYSRKNYPPCQHCGKMGHPPFKCWKRPDAKCNKCNQLGHEVVICKSTKQMPKSLIKKRKTKFLWQHVFQPRAPL